jgi:hypothetical protein
MEQVRRGLPRRRRVALYGAAGVVCALLATVGSRTHQDDLRSVLSSAEASGGSSTVFHRGTAFAAFRPTKGYVVTVCVREDEAFRPAHFVSLVRSPQGFVVEQVIPEGQSSRSEMLDGAVAQDYLRGRRLDVDAIDAVYDRLYAGLAPAAAAKR